MITRMMIAVAFLLTVTAAGFAQDAVAESGWTGVITGQDVNVRSGPALSAYVCTKLSGPQQVTVVGQKGEWLRILPPPTCFSVVSRDYVEADAAGKVGTITSDNIWTRAGGDLRTSEFWVVQCELAKGQKVEILGAINNYYKIAFPPGTCYYVSSQFVRKASDVAAAAPTSQPAGLAEAAPGSGRLEFVRVTTTLTGTTQPAGPAREAFGAAEKALQAEFAKPADQRDFNALLARYQGINPGADKNLATVLGGRISFLQAAARISQANQSAQSTLTTVRQQQTTYDEQLSQIKVTPPEPLPVLPAAQGVIRPSVVYAGTAAILRRYFVCDPATNRVLAFAQSGTVDLQPYVGQVVNLYGPKWFDRQTLVDVVDVQQVEVISKDAVHMPSPPRPVIKPADWRPVEPATNPTPSPSEPAATQESQ
jgi:uncharacterized protein YgiM (DUF1202 family)